MSPQSKKSKLQQKGSVFPARPSVWPRHAKGLAPWSAPARRRFVRRDASRLGKRRHVAALQMYELQRKASAFPACSLLPLPGQKSGVQLC